MQLVVNRIRQKFGARLLPLTALTLGLLPTTGCLSHTHAVEKHRLPDIILSTPFDQLLKEVDDHYNAIQSMQANVEIATTTGGNLKGQVTENIAFSGYVIIGKPENIRVILLVPLLRSSALDMVSDGKTFKMYIQPKDCAIVGSDQVINSSQKGLYSLRPDVILDSLMIRGLSDDQVVSLTQDIRVVENPKKKHDLIEEPDYDLEFLSRPEGHTAKALRVLHISRANLLPYRQDIYNADGKVATQAFYSDYQKFGDINFPTKIVIQRPLDELSLTITLTKKTTFNEKLAADEFNLEIPDTTAHITNMDAPGSVATNPCAASAPQSPR